MAATEEPARRPAAANNGWPHEFRQIDRQQDFLSNQIYRYKHNERW
jgi:hypothetical protein